MHDRFFGALLALGALAALAVWHPWSRDHNDDAARWAAIAKAESFSPAPAVMPKTRLEQLISSALSPGQLEECSDNHGTLRIYIRPIPPDGPADESQVADVLHVLRDASDDWQEVSVTTGPGRKLRGVGRDTYSGTWTRVELAAVRNWNVSRPQWDPMLGMSVSGGDMSVHPLAEAAQLAEDERLNRPPKSVAEALRRKYHLVR